MDEEVIMDKETGISILKSTKNLYLQSEPSVGLVEKRRLAIAAVSKFNPEQDMSNIDIFGVIDIFITNSLNNGITTLDELDSYNSEIEKYVDFAKKMKFNMYCNTGDIKLANNSIFAEFIQLIELGNTDKNTIIKLLS